MATVLANQQINTVEQARELAIERLQSTSDGSLADLITSAKLRVKHAERVYKVHCDNWYDGEDCDASRCSHTYRSLQVQRANLAEKLAEKARRSDVKLGKSAGVVG